MSGNILGTMSEIFQSMNRSSAQFQDKLDLANTAMLNMKLPANIQTVIRDFLLSTESTLSN